MRTKDGERSGRPKEVLHARTQSEYQRRVSCAEKPNIIVIKILIGQLRGRPVEHGQLRYELQIKTKCRSKNAAIKRYFDLKKEVLGIPSGFPNEMSRLVDGAACDNVWLL
ncbi:hypothetical protein GWI33_006167 [Rhynchophorus ferrugineus]|uniref:Uncharacterized protein n=1 Tax=Rhynchophorus ferrugineus TaxID=354439 RepID=A0A834ITW6_RHYFE|nr:hypothetical protein GWI33_006167 [Rhynchophorus ferrugineus]